MNRKLLILLVLIVLSFAHDAEFLGVRQRAQGDGGVALVGDGSTHLTNPATSAFLSGRVASAGYNYLFTNLDNGKLRRGYFSYNNRLKKLGNIGVYGGMMSGQAINQSNIGLNLAYLKRGKRFHYSFGLNPKVYLVNYNASELDYLDGRDSPTDPIWDDEESVSAFSLDAGFYGVLDNKFSFGLSARDILKPDLAISESATSQIQPDISLGFAYSYNKYFQPFVDFSYRMKTDNSDAEMEPRAGFKSRFSSTLRTSMGVNTREIGAGLTFMTSAPLTGMEIDYAFRFPFGETGSAGLTSHYVGISLYLNRIYYTDLDVSVVSIRPLEELKVGEKCPIEVVIANIGSKPLPAFNLTMYSLDSQGKYKIVFPSKFVDGLMPTHNDTLVWNWKPKDADTYWLIASADDNGSNPLEITGTIDEDDEKNNRDSVIVDLNEIVPNATVVPSVLASRVNQVSLLEEEYPITPIVFYDKGNEKVTDIDNLHLMKILAERMENNPDAEMYLRSYIDDSDGEGFDKELSVLAQNRNTEVLNTLNDCTETDISSRIIQVDQNDYDYTSKRILSKGSKTKELDMISSENRRTEFFVQPVKPVKCPNPVTLAKSDNGKSTIVDIDNSTIDLLKRNPDSRILITGYALESEDENLAVMRANNMLNNLSKKYPEISDKLISNGKKGETPSVELTFSFNGILYRPETGTPIVEKFDGVEDKTNVINFTVDSPQSVTSYRLHVLVGQDTVLITEGSGIPDSYKWDWQVNDRLIPIDTEIPIILELITNNGNSYFFESDPVMLEPLNTEEVVKRLILVEYIFDEAVPTSSFLEGRIFLLAQEMIDRASEGQKFELEIAGHTDIIGTQNRNLELSKQRAKREYDRLLIALSVLLEKSDSEVATWMAQNDIILSYKGYGPAESFYINSFRESEPILIGNNDSPRGRTVNRRVIATIRMKN